MWSTPTYNTMRRYWLFTSFWRVSIIILQLETFLVSCLRYSYSSSLLHNKCTNTIFISKVQRNINYCYNSGFDIINHIFGIEIKFMFIIKWTSLFPICFIKILNANTGAAKKTESAQATNITYKQLFFCSRFSLMWL